MLIESYVNVPALFLRSGFEYVNFWIVYGLIILILLIASVLSRSGFVAPIRERLRRIVRPAVIVLSGFVLLFLAGLLVLRTNDPWFAAGPLWEPGLEISLRKRDQSMFPGAFPPQTDQQFRDYVDRTVRLVTHPEVLQNALNHEEVRNLDSLRSHTDREPWLREQLCVETSTDSEFGIIRIGISEAVPLNEAPIIVTSVAEAFVREIIHRTHSEEHAALRSLEDLLFERKQKLERTLDVLQNRIILDTPNAESFSSDRAALLEKLSEHEYKLLIAEADLKTVEERQSTEPDETTHLGGDKDNSRVLLEQVEANVEREKIIINQIEDKLKKSRPAARRLTSEPEVYMLEAEAEQLKSVVQRLWSIVDARKAALAYEEDHPLIRVSQLPDGASPTPTESDLVERVAQELRLLPQD